ncbi:hypothetical protein BGZ73_000744 [Actinomortierella ambigua]|nr:hypothetical protein BGZ73_000744 [Actinomortierella ambigua]
MMSEAIASRNPRQAWHTYSHLTRIERHRQPFSAGTYFRLLLCFNGAKATVPKEWALRVYHDFCQHYTPHLTTLNTLLDLLVANDVPWAIDFFNKEVARHDLLPNVRSQNIILKGLAKSGRMQEAQKLYEQMRSGEVSVRPNVATYSTMMSRYIQQGKIDEANAILDDMFSDKVNPNIWIFNSIIKGYVLKKDYEGARKVMSTMRTYNLAPDVATYSVLVDGYANDHNEEAVAQLHKEMVRNGVEPNIRTITSMLKVFAKAKGGDDGKESLFPERVDKLLAKIPPEELNSWTVSVLMNVYGKRQDLNEAMRLYRLQQKQRRPINDVIINSLLDAHVRAGQLTQANQLFHEHFTARGIRPKSAWTYSTLISGCGRINNLKDAERYFHEMQRFRIEPDVISCSRMIQLYLSHGQGDVAERLARSMFQRKLPVSQQTLAMLMDYKSRGRDMSGVLGYFQQLVRLGHKPDPHTYTILINAHIHTENYAGCDATLKHMLDSGLQPTLATFTSMMHAHSRAGNMERVRALWEAMMEAGHVPDLKAYTLLAQTYSQRNNIEMVEFIYQEMQNKAHKLDMVALSMLIRAYGRLATLDLSRIEELKQQQEVLGLEPTSDYYGSLMDAFGSHRMQDRVVNTWKEMCALERPIPWYPSASNLLYLIEACRDRGYVDVLQSAWRLATRGRATVAPGVDPDPMMVAGSSEGLRVPAPAAVTAYLNALMTHNRFQDVEQTLRRDFLDMDIKPSSEDLRVVFGGLAQYGFLTQELESMRSLVVGQWPQMAAQVDQIIASTKRLA